VLMAKSQDSLTFFGVRDISMSGMKTSWGATHLVWSSFSWTINPQLNFDSILTFLYLALTKGPNRSS
ncbi:hypothetical protein ABUT56_26035, partial [Escherichia coli]|uniref:hypothetical protein n=1 Tax=Escherichia coli TaxID=562 RepID=UPI00336296F4